MRTPTPPAAGRLPGLDRLRGAALLLMLVHHFTAWMAGDARSVIPGWRGFVVSDVAAPAFAVAAGASLHLFVRSRRRRGVRGWPLHRTVVRKYAALVAAGGAMGWVLWDDPIRVGVLGALGVALLGAYVLSRLLPDTVIGVLALAALSGGWWVERVARAWPEGSAGNVLLGGSFPLVLYSGFVLAGLFGARRLGERDRPRAAIGLGLALAAVTCFMAAVGVEPDRYPGGGAFVVPGLAGTLLLYGLLAGWEPRRAGVVDAAVRRAAAHTFGIFVTHYGLYAALRRTGLRGEVPAPLAVVLAIALAGAFVAVAPHVPPLPWARRRDGAVPPPAFEPAPVPPVPLEVQNAGTWANSCASNERSAPTSRYR